MKQNLLVTLADQNYIPQAKQLFSSVYWNAGWDGDYMLLAHEIPEEELKWFADKGILIKRCKPLYNHGTGEFLYPPVIFDKLYLFTSEFKKWKNIIFLDADIIVKAPIDRLVKIKYFGAARDMYFKKLNSQLYDLTQNCFNNKTYDLNVPAFNSGVFAFNTKIITANLFDELLGFINNHISVFKFPEQALLNLCFYRKWEQIKLIYHIFYVHHYNKLPKKLKYVIIHFTRTKDLPSLWEPENSFYREWKTNLDRAELIDLNKVEKVKKWSVLKINYNTLLLKIYLAPDKLKHIFYEIRSFFVYRLKTFFLYLINTPDRLIGKSGLWIRKRNPDLYNKLRKIKGEDKRNLLVTLADKNFIQQAKQLFSSVYWNTGWEGDYMLMAHEIPDEELKWFIQKGILIKKCSPLWDTTTGEYNYPPVLYDKCYLFTTDLKKWKNVVFLDADIIAKAPLDRLTKIKYVGGARDFYFSKLYTQFYDPSRILSDDKNINLNSPVLNTGVVAFNTDIITTGTFKELIILLKDHISNSKFGDQPLLNLYFYKKWKKIPLIYHIFIGYHKYKLPRNIKYIAIHFIRNKDFPSIWEPGNSFYPEWKVNLDKAELMDLNKIQQVKKWSTLKINYYTLLLKIYLAPDKLIHIFYGIRSFFVYRLKSIFLYIINTPDKLIGKTGLWIRKRNPDLYNKLRKIKGGR